MTILEAYQKTLEVAEELRAAGIPVTIRPSNSPNDGTDEVLPRDKWVIITFKVKNREEAQLVGKKATELGWSGIVFDTSGTKGERDWEIDWSFHLEDTPDPEWEAARDEVEDMIDGPSQGPELV